MLGDKVSSPAKLPILQLNLTDVQRSFDAVHSPVKTANHREQPRTIKRSEGNVGRDPPISNQTGYMPEIGHRDTHALHSQY